MRVFREFTFEAAHRLTCVGEGHPCARVHGHSYRVRLEYAKTMGRNEVRGAGWVFDWGVLDAEIADARARFDHRLLNEVLENPTAERLALALFALFVRGPFGSWLSSVEVRENPTCGVTVTEADYYREDIRLEFEAKP